MNGTGSSYQQVDFKIVYMGTMHYRSLTNLDICVFRSVFVDLVKRPANKRYTYGYKTLWQGKAHAVSQHQLAVYTWLTANSIEKLGLDSNWLLHDKDNVHRYTKKNTTKGHKLWHWILPQRNNHQKYCHQEHETGQQQPYLHVTKKLTIKAVAIYLWGDVHEGCITNFLRRRYIEV